MIGQSFLDYLNILRAQEVTLEDARKSALVQNEQSLEWPLQLEGQQGLKEDWGVESTANWLQVQCLHLRQGIPICVILDIIVLRVYCKVSVAEKGSVAIFVISACC